MKRLMLSLVLLLTVVTIGLSQGTFVTGVAPVTVTLADAIALAPGSFALEGLQRGKTYHVFYSYDDAAFVYVDMAAAQDAAGGAPADWTPFEATVTPGATVKGEFIYLPTTLLSETGGALPVSFPRAWAGVDLGDPTGIFSFIPTDGFTMPLGFAQEVIQFAPEMIVTVPGTASGTDFLGIIIARVEYVF